MTATAYDLARADLAELVERIAPSWRFADENVLTGDLLLFEAPGGSPWIVVQCASCRTVASTHHDEGCRGGPYVAAVFVGDPEDVIAFEVEIADLAILLPIIDDARRSGRIAELIARPWTLRVGGPLMTTRSCTTSRPPTPEEDRATRRILLETERARVRLQGRSGVGTACSSCGATHPAALVAGSEPPSCYGCRVPWDSEGNHAAGHACGPVIEMPANEHRLFSEGERIGHWAMRGLDVPTDTAFGLGLFVGLRLGRLGSIGGES